MNQRTAWLRLCTIVAVMLCVGLALAEAAGRVRVRSYYRKDGTYVSSHYRTAPDGSPYNNYSFPGNYNPNTGKVTPGDPETYLRSYYKRSGSSYRLPAYDLFGVDSSPRVGAGSGALTVTTETVGRARAFLNSDSDLVTSRRDLRGALGGYLFLGRLDAPDQETYTSTLKPLFAWPRAMGRLELRPPGLERETTPTSLSARALPTLPEMSLTPLLRRYEDKSASHTTTTKSLFGGD